MPIAPLIALRDGVINVGGSPGVPLDLDQPYADLDQQPIVDALMLGTLGIRPAWIGLGTELDPLFASHLYVRSDDDLQSVPVIYIRKHPFASSADFLVARYKDEILLIDDFAFSFNPDGELITAAGIQATGSISTLGDLAGRSLSLTGSFGGNAGSPKFAQIDATIAQGGSAGYVGIDIDINEVSIGSGKRRVAIGRVNGAIILAFDSDGAANFEGPFVNWVWTDGGSGRNANLNLSSAGNFVLNGITNSFKVDFEAGLLFLNNTQVLKEQEPAISDSVGGDEQAKINEILTAMRNHGLIAT